MASDKWLKIYRRIQKRIPRQRAAWQKSPRCWVPRRSLMYFNPDIEITKIAGIIHNMKTLFRNGGVGRDA